MPPTGSLKKKVELVRRLAQTRIHNDPIARQLGSIDRLSDFTVMGLPEATIVTIVEMYWNLKNQGASELDILELIENQRVSAGSGTLPKPLTLSSYIKYRARLEHSHGAVISDEFIDHAIQEASEALAHATTLQPTTPRAETTPREMFARKPVRNWILRLWRGEVSLAKAFWGYLFLGNVVFSIPLLVILIRFEKTGQPAHPVFTASLFILSVFYFTVACVGVWRSASRYQGRKVWAVLARIIVVGSIARNISELIK